MQRFTLLSKVFLTLTLASGALWLGSYTVKLFNFYNLFDLGQNNSLILKGILVNTDLKPVIFELLPVLSISLISYMSFIVFSAIFLLNSKVNIKANGWLFIAIMIVLLCFPFEVFLSLKEYNLIQMILNNSGNTTEMIDLIKTRINALSSFPIVSIILHYSLFILFVFKPLTKKN